MKVAIVGAGPAGLYLAILLKRDDPGHQVTVYERNRVEDTFGFGVVFSDETLENVGEADPETNQAMAAAAARWEDIEIHYRGTVIRSTGHRFSGVERKTLLELLATRAQALGVEIQWQREIRDLADCALPTADLIVAADGAGSAMRDRMSDRFEPRLDWRRNRFVWLGTTRPFPAFTFYFKSSPAGLWRTHAYQYAAGRSTFIVEAREETWQASGLARTMSGQPSPTWSGSSAMSCRATRSRPTAPSGGGSLPSGTPVGTRATWSYWATPPTRRTSRWARAPSWPWRTRSRWRRR